jgi:fatty-acyl-CoA synthase
VGQAVVVVRDGVALTPSDLLAHLEGRLARYKIPKHVRFVDELPHNASGKLVKARIKDMVRLS